MQEQRQEQIARYLSGYISSHSIKSLTTWITYGVGYFDALGLTWPNDSDYQGLRAEMLGTLPGVKKGTVISSGQADKRVAETRKFYEWLKQQEGETKQVSLFEETEAGGIEPEGAGMAQHGEIEPVSSEGVAEGADAGATVEEVTTGREDSGSLSVDTPEAEYITDTEQKPKRGRKSKAESEKRTVKLSIYLTPTIYKGMKTLASATQQDVSDIFFTLAEEYVTRNSDKVQDIRSFFARLGAIR